MPAIYNKVKNEVDPYQLQFDINASVEIQAICESITFDNGSELTLTFNTELTVEEEEALDAIIMLHTPSQELFAAKTLPFSRHLDGKLAVHSSAKPEPEGCTTYAIWSGAGDDPNLPIEESIGAGDLLSFSMTTGVPVVTKDVRYDPRHGRVWIHEAYLKFENGGTNDYLIADIMAPATALQQAINLDLVVENDWVKYAPGGPGTGTHGWAGTPVLMARTKAKDGDWDFDGTSLMPNFAGNGGYKITAIERIAHRYFNKVPLNGSSTTYFSMTSDETAELPVDAGYFIRISIHNNSDSNWTASVLMEIYRERTYMP